MKRIFCTNSDRLLHPHTWLSIDQINATTQSALALTLLSTLGLTLLTPWLVEVVVASNPVAFGGRGTP
jgi:hypothetical protein